jgi:hypothetical protein
MRSGTGHITHPSVVEINTKGEENEIDKETSLAHSFGDNLNADIWLSI